MFREARIAFAKPKTDEGRYVGGLIRGMKAMEWPLRGFAQRKPIP
jgi:hypothetical protein